MSDILYFPWELSVYLTVSLVTDSKFSTEREVVQGCPALSRFGVAKPHVDTETQIFVVSGEKDYLD